LDGIGVLWATIGRGNERLCNGLQCLGREELVGLAEVLDDGAMNAYLHYLLVKPEYQKCGIGRELLNRVKDKYKNYTNLILIAYAEKEEFYRCCGFESGKDKIPMFCIALNVPER
jgi:GNAT superfamily N-acetyltransferase